MIGNATSATHIHSGVLETFIPGYSLLSKFLFETFGYDISFLVSASFVLVGLTTALKFVWKYMREAIWRFLMSNIRVERNDDIYDQIMEWIAAHKMSMNSRNLLAKTGYENWEVDDDEAQVGDHLQIDGLLNFSNWDSKRPPKFIPGYGLHYFFHRGSLFLFSRDQKTLMDSGAWGFTTMRDDEYVTLSCLGRSTQPIKNLLREARDAYLNRKKACTTVRRPAPKQNRNNRSGNWIRAAIRPSRPMQTVVLDSELKDRVLQDINEYLHPATPRWYSDRGIPYRRGYLLHGPPGTGKSSLAWAVAGCFGLDIYVVSLVDPNLTEEELGFLFTTLPRRCVVLLEDIDSAGLKRQEGEEATKANDESQAAKIGAEITKAFESVQKKTDKEKGGITLSGLLNAVDGVAAQEGRVLIMTTNFVDKLDDALIRPGRIDMKIPFTCANRKQIQELFTRIYAPSMKLVAESPNYPAEKKASQVSKTLSLKETQGLPANFDPSALTPPDTPMGQTTPVVVCEERNNLEDIAAKFASLLPEDTFTPAEIQGFLLTHKKDPGQALEDTPKWRDQLTATKQERKGKEEGV